MFYVSKPVLFDVTKLSGPVSLDTPGGHFYGNKDDFLITEVHSGRQRIVKADDFAQSFDPLDSAPAEYPSPAQLELIPNGN